MKLIELKNVGLYFTEKFPIRDEIRYAQLAEQKGFNSVWQGESRLARDSLTPIIAIATVTSRIRVGTGLIHVWTRNPAIIATTFATLDELSDGRAMLGIGVLWDPMASKIGIKRSKPLKAIREYVQALRRLFNMETVTFNGEFVSLNGVRLERAPKHIPIYVGATGFQMMEVAGEIGDGVLLNYLVSPHYNREALKHIERGAKAAKKILADVDRPQLVACSIHEDADLALDKARLVVTEYLAIEPHIAIASGVKEDLTVEIRRKTGGWPPRPGSLEESMELVDDETVKLLTASGTSDDCRRKVNEYVESGCTSPLLYPIGENVEDLINTFSD